MTAALKAAASIGDALNWAKKTLEDSGVENGAQETLWILEHVSNLPTLALNFVVRKNEILEQDVHHKFQNLIRERARRTPLAYLLASQEFMGLNFYVDARVLVPRPETEILVRKALEIIGGKAAKVLDVGTGSGNIAVSIAKFCENAEITATDISEKALEVARRNARFHGISDRIRFLHGNLLEPAASNYDIIVSNPPYIPTAEMEGLQAEVKREPETALDGGEDGLRVLKPLIRRAGEFLAPGGFLIMEMGHDQAQRVKEMMTASGYDPIAIMKDDSGTDRGIAGQKKLG